jgi:glycogen debranching enzyme
LPSYIEKADTLQLRQPEASSGSIGRLCRQLSRVVFLAALLSFSSLPVPASQTGNAASADPHAASAARPLELSRPVRSWEFLSAVGTRAGLFGNESGQFEAWVYPLKILAGFQLRFHAHGRILPASTLARTITVRPESVTLHYAWETFSVRETLFVPISHNGAIIALEVETREPLQVEAGFRRDFQLEWPAALGGTFIAWDPGLHGFLLSEELKKYAAIVGSPAAVDYHEEYSTNYSTSRENTLLLRPVKDKETQLIAIAASFQGRADAESTYKALVSSYDSLRQAAADYYAQYLNQTTRLELPDDKLQQAYDWSRISMVQGLVANPYLGTSLIAGYRTSGEDQRPGFAWFFGRDALWSSLALNSTGDFHSTRTLLEFLAKYQRADGKIPHEVSQSASVVDWFKTFPYAYASADATPLFIIAANDYVVGSGDKDFAHQYWESLWKAYQFMRSTYDAQGLPQNLGVGHGWVEGGPLLPVKTELYQSGLGAEALRALANLARIVGEDATRRDLEQSFARQRSQLDEVFWAPEKNSYVYALDPQGKRLPTESVLTTVPMWFGLLDPVKAGRTIDRIADYDHAADWGMRILSSQDPRYNPGGYHFGSVWPLFTGWAAVGEYRYHHPLAAYANLRANALLAFDGSLGHVTEVLSGDYNQTLSTGSPHQIWSAAMVVSPLLRGMMGLETDALAHRLRFAPHLPADWSAFSIDGIPVGKSHVSLAYSRTPAQLSLIISNQGPEPVDLEFSPAVSLRARLGGAELDGHSLSVRSEPNSEDVHPTMRASIGPGEHTLRLHVRNDFGITVPGGLPPLGASSRNLKITAQSWNPGRDRLQISYSGLAGGQYELQLWNAEQVASVEGGELLPAPDRADRDRGEKDRGEKLIRIRLPNTGSGYLRGSLAIGFSGR